MPESPITVPISFVENLLSQVDQHGYSVPRLLADSGIEPRDLKGHYFSAPRYGKLYQRAMWVFQDEWFGMLSGGPIRKGSFRLLSLSVLHCKTLRQGLIRTREFSQICRGFKVSGQLEELDDVARLRLAPLDCITAAEFEQLLATVSPVVIHTTLATLHRYYSWLIGRDIPVDRVYFTFPGQGEVAQMASLSPKERVFEHDFNGIEFPARFLDYPITQTEESLEEFLRLAPFDLVVKTGEGQALSDRVKALLNQNVSHAMLSSEQIARRLNMSVTTMRRKLQKENTSFQQLKDECRMEAAFHYLGCPDLSNREIADRLGFDEISTFFRAFKKWTGVTPGQYRSGEIEPGT
ncbi:MAG: AraC family transcriptional regulator [Gammaproteobacteria bacterium]|nr:AraC family transcriptional regulator [Gammaproteobacteria bacterium]